MKNRERSTCNTDTADVQCLEAICEQNQFYPDEGTPAQVRYKRFVYTGGMWTRVTPEEYEIARAMEDKRDHLIH